MIPTKGKSGDLWAVTEMFSFLFWPVLHSKMLVDCFCNKSISNRKTKYFSLLSIDQYQVFRKPVHTQRNEISSY